MDAELLQQWSVLHPLDEDEIKKIAYLAVLPGNPDRGCAALFINKDTHEVYCMGSSNLRSVDLIASICVENNSTPSSSGKLKINRFSGLGLEKIVVGGSVVGGLNEKGQVHFWYYPKVKPEEDEVVALFGRYTAPDTICHGSIENTIGPIAIVGYKAQTKLIHSSKYPIKSIRDDEDEEDEHHFYTRHDVGGVALNYCHICKKFCIYTKQSPPLAGSSVAKFVKSKLARMACPKCSYQCSTSLDLGGFSLEYCKHCNICPEYSIDRLICTTNEYYASVEASRALQLHEASSEGCVDIACGENFVALLTHSNDLIVHGYIRNVEFWSSVCNPNQINIRSFSCGAHHLAAISSSGELYTCGFGGHGQLGYALKDFSDLTLRKVQVEGVIKVCCGYSSTVCLTWGGSVYCFGTHMKLSQEGSLLVNQKITDIVTEPTKILEGEIFTDIANSPQTDKFCARTNSLVYLWGHKSAEFPRPEVKMGASRLMEALVNHPIAVSCGDLSSRKKFKVSVQRQNSFASLYGEKQLSDILLKLSDGDFPGHGLILFSKSVYFRDHVLGEADSFPKELDVTHYNPVAYKTLLQYFYQVPPDNLDCVDLIDLYLLAASYKEREVMTDSFDKLKEKINVDTVKLIHGKAKTASCEELLQECELFMHSPEFQAKILDVLKQSTDTTLSLL